MEEVCDDVVNTEHVLFIYKVWHETATYGFVEVTGRK